MNSMRAEEIDPRAWLLWGVGLSLPPLLGRNPWPLLLCLMIGLAVRRVVLATSGEAGVPSGIIKLAALFGLISAVFNALTVRSGDIVLFNIPDWVPLVDGDVTFNAVMYGLLGGVAILVLVLAATTTVAALDRSMLLRMLPDSMLGLGVAGSVALTFFPQTLVSFREIRDARAIRGEPLSGARSLLIVAPAMLNSGLERAVVLAELMESRGFGGVAANKERNGLSSAVMVVALGSFCAAVYAFATGGLVVAAVLAGGATLALIGLHRVTDHSGTRRTRYRTPIWNRGATLICAGALVAVAGVVLTLAIAPEGLRYEPYPTLAAPYVSLPLLFSLAFLMAPVLVLRAGPLGAETS